MNVINETNVYLLAKNVLSQDSEGNRQKFYYSPGVGSSVWTRIPGGVAGFGLHEHLLDGYEWLCQNYDDGDEIWIFGFSRGAYTARSLSGMIRKSGLLYITNPMTLQAALANYRNWTNSNSTSTSTPTLPASRQSSNAEDIASSFRKRFSREVSIHFLGVWDTVGALGIPGGGWINRGLQWHDTRLSGIVKHAYHAMAIDEHREIFSSTPWVLPTPRAIASSLDQQTQFGRLADGRIVEQRWFVGSHGDVGGGCADSSLSKIPLAWMETQAIKAGLALRNSPSVPPNANMDPIYPSFEKFGSGIYKLVRNLPLVGKGPHYRPVVTDHKQTEVIHPCLDPSVLDRWHADKNYRPKGIGDITHHTIRPWDMHSTDE